MGSDFSDLIRRAKAGEQAALTELYERYAPHVLRTVREWSSPLVERRDGRDDIVQSVFKDVLGALPEFEDRGEDAFRRWLAVLAKTKILSKMRGLLHRDGGRRDETPSVDPAPRAPGPGPATEAGESDDLRRLEEVLAGLEPGHREMLTLHELEGSTYAEIAVLLGLPSEEAARMRHSRALAALIRAWNAR